ncbi:MAG: MFS transporter [Caldilineaceae bacterium]|nr:MFS transporter [Caldilineaceae bacterium]
MSTNLTSKSTQQRITWTLFATQSLFSATMIASFTLLPILSAQFGGSDSVAGIPNTLTMLGRALIAYPIGWLMDKHGRRLGLTIGYGLAAMGGLLSAYSIGLSSFMILSAGSMLAGMGRGVTEQARFVAGDARTGAERASAIGLIVLAGTVGAVGGPLMVEPTRAIVNSFGYLADTGPFMAMVALNLVAMVMVFLLLRPDPLLIARFLEENTGSGVKKPIKPARPVSEIFAGSLVRLAIGAMVIGQLVMTLIMVITPLYMHHHNHGAGPISGVIMAHTLGMFGLSTVTSKLIERFGRTNMIYLGAGVLALSAILTPISLNAWALGVALFLLGLGWNFCFIAGSSLLADALAPNERGKAQGANEMLVALASGVGSAGTGVAFAQGGIVVVSAIGLGFSLLLIAATMWVTRRTTGVVVSAGD